MSENVRIVLRPDEFARLLEILEDFDDEPVVLKLRAKALSHQATKIQKEMTASFMTFTPTFNPSKKQR